MIHPPCTLLSESARLSVSLLLGGWLDDKFGIAPVFRLILLFVALGMSFAYLIKQVSVAKDVEEENRKAKEKRGR